MALLGYILWWAMYSPGARRGCSFGLSERCQSCLIASKVNANKRNAGKKKRLICYNTIGSGYLFIDKNKPIMVASNVNCNDII